MWKIFNVISELHVKQGNEIYAFLKNLIGSLKIKVYNWKSSISIPQSRDLPITDILGFLLM